MIKKAMMILIGLIYPMLGMGNIQAKQGDIIVFNAPLQLEEIKAQLFSCKPQKWLCTEWEPVDMPSPVLKPGAYYVFRLSDKNKENLVASSISLKIYNVSKKQWSPPLRMITHYHADEVPFYQLICWSHKDRAPYFACSDSNSGTLEIGYFHRQLPFFYGSFVDRSAHPINQALI